MKQMIRIEFYMLKCFLNMDDKTNYVFSGSFNAFPPDVKVYSAKRSFRNRSKK